MSEARVNRASCTGGTLSASIVRSLGYVSAGAVRIKRLAKMPLVGIGHSFVFLRMRLLGVLVNDLIFLRAGFIISVRRTTPLCIPWNMRAGLTRQPRRIGHIHRIIPNVGIKIEIILVSDRIGLHEASQRWRVVARAVVVEARLRIEIHAHILEGFARQRAAIAVGIVGERPFDQRACRTRGGHHRAVMIGVVIFEARARARAVGLRGAGAVLVDDGLVDGRARHEAPEHVARGIVFGDLVRTVVEEEGLRDPGAGFLGAPAERIIGVVRPHGGEGRTGSRLAGEHEPVLRIVGVFVGAVVGEIAVGVVAERRRRPTPNLSSRYFA